MYSTTQNLYRRSQNAEAPLTQMIHSIPYPYPSAVQNIGNVNDSATFSAIYTNPRYLISNQQINAPSFNLGMNLNPQSLTQLSSIYHDKHLSSNLSTNSTEKWLVEQIGHTKNLSQGLNLNNPVRNIDFEKSNSRPGSRQNVNSSTHTETDSLKTLLDIQQTLVQTIIKMDNNQTTLVQTINKMNNNQTTLLNEVIETQNNLANSIKTMDSNHSILFTSIGKLINTMILKLDQWNPHTHVGYHH